MNFSKQIHLEYFHITAVRYSFLVLACLFLNILTGFKVQAEEMKLVFADYKPYSWQDDQGVAHGLEIDILKEALQNRMGIEVSYSVLPWARAQLYVKEGKADGFVAVPTSKRKSYTKASSEPITAWGASIFTRSFGDQVSALKKTQNIADLKSFKLGSMIGNGWAEQNLKGLDVTWVATMTQLINVTTKKRVDALVDSSVVIKYYLKEMGLKGKLAEIKNITTSGLYLCIGFSSDYLDRLAEFDKTIKAMREDGSLDRIIKKYQ